MKLIIAGGRDFRPEPKHAKWLDELRNQLTAAGTPITEVVCGMARGADTFGLNWSGHYENLTVKKFPAQWAIHGRSAGPKRNRQMAEYADAVVLFPGGRGTQNMYETAMDLGLKIFDWRRRE